MTNHLFLWVLGGFVGSFAVIPMMYRRGLVNVRSVLAFVLAGFGVVVGSRLQYRLESMPLDWALEMSLADLLEPGVRIPLGMLLGGVVAAGWCALVRLPWRDVGDGMAVAALVMIPFGRLGCWLNGCCLGTACPAWLPFCPTFAIGSEPYSAQLAHGLIDGTAERSLPAHPLSIYFAVVAVLILAVVVRMIRRGASPGVPLAVALVLASAGKLALETLRSTPRPMGATWIVPTATLLVTVAALAVGRLRAPARAQVVRRAGVLGLLAALAAGGAAVPVRADDGGREAAVREALGRYASDPLGARRALRRLARHGIDDLPPVVVLALGDSQLRSGRWRNAARYFEATLERAPGDPWETWALVGLSASALMAGDIDVARTQLEALEAKGGRNGPVASLLIGVIDVGDGLDAGARFGRIAEMPEAAPQVQDMARLMSAYSLYWRGEYAAAAASFDRLADRLSSIELRDDAAYGAAWSRMRAGDTERAERDLRALAEQETRRARVPASVALVNLDPRALVRAAFQRYRHAQLSAPEDWFARGFDTDGPGLARAALRRLKEASRPEAAPSVGAASPLRTSYRMYAASDAPARPAAPRPRPAPAPAPEPAAPAVPEPPGRVPMVAIALLGVAAYLLLARRRPAGSTAGRRTGTGR